MKWNAQIVKVGSEAVDPRENIIILFDEEAIAELQKVSVIQKFAVETPRNNFTFKKGDVITINQHRYEAMAVGSMVQMNMRSIGHATLVFIDAVPEQPMKNAIYLKKADEEVIPAIEAKDSIIYEHK